jgi:glutathione S-transferase
MMKLYGFGATRSLRALWALRELDAEFEFVPVNLLAGEHRCPDFLRLNPAGKIPVLVDGDVLLTESAAIVMYLAEKYRDKGLLPAALGERAQVYRWDKRLPDDVALAGQEFVAMAAVLDRHMEGRQFIVGDSVTVADCITAHTLDWGNERRLIDGYPQLRAYLERMYARPKAPQRIAEAFANLRAGT